jgi:Uma2 family endonuclease
MSENAAHRHVATWEDYASLPEDVRREYIDGEIVMTPFPSTRHALTILRLQNACLNGLPDTVIPVSHTGWKVHGNEYGPDVMLVPATCADDVRFEGVPYLVVEVISTNRAMDTVTKLQKYAPAGAPRYWLVDLRDRTLLALVLVDGIYEVAAQLDEGNPAADLDTGAGNVRIDLTELFA